MYDYPCTADQLTVLFVHRYRLDEVKSPINPAIIPGDCLKIEFWHRKDGDNSLFFELFRNLPQWIKEYDIPPHQHDDDVPTFRALLGILPDSTIHYSPSPAVRLDDHVITYRQLLALRMYFDHSIIAHGPDFNTMGKIHPDAGVAISTAIAANLSVQLGYANDPDTNNYTRIRYNWLAVKGSDGSQPANLDEILAMYKQLTFTTVDPGLPIGPGFPWFFIITPDGKVLDNMDAEVAVSVVAAMGNRLPLVLQYSDPYRDPNGTPVNMFRSGPLTVVGRHFK